jgi:2',3'-cyclic-nucleotide 2'-phosphodiesterase (5'-nucleotidase family)
MEGIGPDSELSLAIGHFARLKTVIDRLQKIAPSRTLTLDSGDSFAGALFHLLTASAAFTCETVPPVELKFLSDANYDATVFGNHDFDGFDDVILDTLQCASKTTSVPVLSSNINVDTTSDSCKHLIFNFTDPEKLSYGPSRSLLSDQGRTLVTSHILKELTNEKGQKLKVAIVGTHGPDSSELSVVYRRCIHFRGYDDITHKKDFDGWVHSVQEAVNLVKKQHKPDVVILLAHAGAQEDEQLVNELQKRTKDDRFIDLHISSHTHELYLKVFGKTIVPQVDAYGMYLGVLQLEYDFDTKTITLLNEKIPTREAFYIDTVTDSALLPTQIQINSNIPMNKEYLEKIEEYKRMIDASFLKNFEFKYATQIGNVPTVFPKGITFSIYAADCILKEVRKEMGNSTDTVSVFFLNDAAIRIDVPFFYSLNKTKLPFQFSDVYRALSIGTLTRDISEEKLPGDVIAHFYMTKKELKTFIQANLVLKMVNPNYVIAFSTSYSYKTRWWGIPFINRIYDIQIDGVSIDKFPNMIHVAMPNWMTKYYRNLGEMSFGILSSTFHDKYGRDIPQPYLLFKHEYELFARCIKNQ